MPQAARRLCTALHDKIIHSIQRFVTNPYVNCMVGLILFGTGLSEAWDSLYDDIINLRLKVHHGFMILGIFNVLKTIPDIILSLEHIHRGVKK
jgi:hypothetical protein